MQTTSATWKRLWAAGAPLEARAAIAGTVYTTISAPVIHRAAMQERLSVGNVAAASLTLGVRGAAAIPRSAAVVIEARLNDGTTASEWLPQGTFYVSRRARDPVTGVVALECYDALMKANAVWTPSQGSWPRTMAAVAAELLALLGLEMDSRTAIPSGAAFAMSAPAAGTTLRDALGTIAQAGGGNWIVTPAGKLRLVPISDASNAEEAENDVVDVIAVTGAMDAGASGAITGVRCTAEGEVMLTGDDSGIVVDVSVAPMIAVEAAELLIGRRYQAYRLTGAVCDPAAELGDWVRAGANGEIASALYSQQIALSPACRSEIAAPEAGELTDEYPYIGPREQAISLIRAQVKTLSQTAVAGTTLLYASGASATDPPASGWSTTPPTHAEGRYVWQKTVTLYVNGESETGEPVNISGADGEPAAVLRIDSSRGTVFKDNNVSTVLSVSVHYGRQIIESITALRAAFGASARLQWEWLRMDEDRYGVISADDSRLSDGGFRLTLGPTDVDVKVTFRCKLITD